MSGEHKHGTVEKIKEVIVVYEDGCKRPYSGSGSSTEIKTLRDPKNTKHPGTLQYISVHLSFYQD